MLSSETITLHHENTALESAQILSETRQIYRWSEKDRLILGKERSKFRAKLFEIRAYRWQRARRFA